MWGLFNKDEKPNKNQPSRQQPSLSRSRSRTRGGQQPSLETGSGEMFSNMNMGESSDMFSGMAMSTVPEEAPKTEVPSQSSGFSFVTETDDAPSSGGFSFIQSDTPETSEPTGFSFTNPSATPDQSSSIPPGDNTNSSFSFMTVSNDPVESAPDMTMMNMSASPGRPSEAEQKPNTPSRQEVDDIFAQLVAEQNKPDPPKEKPPQTPEQPAVAEPSSSGSMFDMTAMEPGFSLLGDSSAPAPEPEAAPEEAKPKRPRPRPRPKAKRRPEPTKRDPPKRKSLEKPKPATSVPRVPVVKKEPVKTYENNLPGQSKKHKDSCERQTKKLWLQIQTAQQYHTTLLEKEQTYLQTLEEKKQECVVLEEAQMRAIEEEDYDLADEKDRTLGRTKKEISRIERRIREAQKDIKTNLKKKNHNFGLLRIVHEETSGALKACCEKFKAENMASFKREKENIDSNLAGFQAKFDRASRILENTNEELAGIDEQEKEIDDKIRDQNQEIVQEQENLKKARDRMNGEIEQLKEQIRQKEIEVCEMEDTIADLSAAIEEAKGEFKEDLDEIEGSRQRILMERQEHMNDQNHVSEQITVEKNKKEKCFKREEEFLKLLESVNAYQENMKSTASLIADLESHQEKWERIAEENMVKISTFTSQIEELQGDAKAQQLEALQEEIEAKRTHLSFIENKLPALKAQKQKHVTAKRFRDAGVVHREIKQLEEEQKKSVVELKELEAQEQTLEEECAGKVKMLEQLRADQAEAELAKDRQQFDVLTYMIKWIQRFLLYVDQNDELVQSSFNADLVARRTELEVLKQRHGWAEASTPASPVPEEAESPCLHQTEAAPAEDPPRPEPAAEESLEDLHVALAEATTQLEDLNVRMEKAIEAEDYEEAATVQDEMDKANSAIEKLKERISECEAKGSENAEEKVGAAEEKAEKGEPVEEEPVKEETPEEAQIEDAPEPQEPEDASEVDQEAHADNVDVAHEEEKSI